MIRVDRRTGAAERIAPSVSPWPAPRVRPAVALGSGGAELIVFGGTTHGMPLTDAWAYSFAAGTWRRIAAPCSGSGCPVVTGGEKLAAGAAGREIAVVADPTGPAAGKMSWTLEAGTWTSWLERADLSLLRDCDRDRSPEPAWGARCGAGTEGFPAHGRLRCDGGALACRMPVAPGAVLREHVAPGMAGPVAREEQVALLLDGRLDLHVLRADGGLDLLRTVRLSRPGHDVALAGGYALVADVAGLTVYSMADGTEVAAAPSCGKARRVFVNGGRAYVVGLRALLVLDVSTPAAPRVLGRYRIGAAPGRRASVGRSDGCSWLRDAEDIACDLSGVCGPSGRIAAAEAGNRLFLNLLGETYVLDFTLGADPVVSEPIRTGHAFDMRVEAGFLYVNRAGNRGLLFAQQGGAWRPAGGHDVRRWVEGVAETGRFAVWRRPGRLVVGTRQ